MQPILRACGFPATLYAATYYMQKQTQVFNVAAAYVLWRAQHLTLDLDGLCGTDGCRYPLTTPAEREIALDTLITYADTLAGAGKRQELLRRLCTALDLDWRTLESKRIATYLSIDEARQLVAQGMDVQLHTHRHRLPANDIDGVRREIEDNRSALTGIGTRPLVHFCYPSGEYVPEQLAWLQDLGIKSATTCLRRLNRRDTPILQLCRFLDSERFSMLEFEAEMSGFMDLTRRVFK
jgi:peptidoglycan/xylan/chitin deacetylase (PgdA/CDA1 family)